jgi:mRNA interferase MazF
MKRGDIVLVTAPGDYGKRRPAVIIQSGLFLETHATVLVCLISSDIQKSPLFRLDIAPAASNGLRVKSQIMADKIFAMQRKRLSDPIGALDEDTLMRLNRALMLFQGLA